MLGHSMLLHQSLPSLSGTVQAHSHHVSPEEGTSPDPSTHLSSPASTPPASNRRSHLSFQEMLRQQLGQQVRLKLINTLLMLSSSL